MRPAIPEAARSSAREHRQDSINGEKVLVALRESWGALRDYSMMTAVWAADRVVGPGILSWILLPWTAINALRRLRDYPHFARLRSSLPANFWRGTGRAKHYARMIFHWQLSLAYCVLSHRLSEPRWRRRIRIHGTPPEQCDDFKKRPIIIACLHTGGFIFLRQWLRSRGIAAAGLVKARPEIIRRYEQRVSQRQDNGLPYFFHVNNMRAVARFLAPGRILIIAVEWQPGLFPVVVQMGAPFRMGEGAVRLARMANAMLVPASVWLNNGIDICFGNPVPQELIDPRDTQPALQFLAHEFWKDLAQDPCAIGWTTMEAYAPEKMVRPRTRWP